LNKRITARTIAGLLALWLVMPLASAQTGALTAEPTQDDAAERAQTIRKLQTIRAALEDRREQVRNLLEQLAEADEIARPKIREQIEAQQQIIRDLMDSFETIAVNGTNLRNLADARDKGLDWRDEMIQIARPIIDGLKEATEKPRRIAELRTSIELYQQQLAMTGKAIESLARFDQQDLPPGVAAGLNEVAAAWRRRHDDIKRTLEVSREELGFLETEKTRVFETMGNVAYGFILGRGLTLLFALITGVLVWYAMRALRRLATVRRRQEQDRQQAAKVRLLLYGYHLLTMVLVALAVLSVFYVRGDVLLLSLAIIALVMLALGVWRFLPGYIEEARLLLNAGAARQGERVIYNGLPFRIATLNLYSELRNPELDGVIRLPLKALAQLTSRPRSDEEWFPCRKGDYLLLPDGSFGQVLQQSVELVRLKVIGSIVQYSAADFLQLNVRNLSREGFGVVVVFGIDYQHQEISLDRVPQRFKSGLEAAFEKSVFGADLKDLLVEFKQAGSSSLDYLIYATMGGDSAASYFTIGRMIQQTCVDICNEEGWVIPFTQVTIHQADTAPVEIVPAGEPQQA